MVLKEAAAAGGLSENGEGRRESSDMEDREAVEEAAGNEEGKGPGNSRAGSKCCEARRRPEAARMDY